MGYELTSPMLSLYWHSTQKPVPNNVWYQNLLAAMRPNTTNKDVPSGHEVSKYIHNEFANWVKKMKEDLQVNCLHHCATQSDTFVQSAPGKISMMCDAWTAGLMRKGFRGVTGHWIEVIDGKWSPRSELVRFSLIVGKHTGLNLGWHFVCVCDCVGVWTPEQSKVIRSIA